MGHLVISALMVSGQKGMNIFVGAMQIESGLPHQRAAHAEVRDIF